jgi:electron transfer flavoprotein beta subunit
LRLGLTVLYVCRPPNGKDKIIILCALCGSAVNKKLNLNKKCQNNKFMKIIVCAKQIRHTYARTGISPESHFICPEDGIYRVNPHDEAALELALGLKDKYENITVTLLTLGPMIAQHEIQRCMATGADDLYQIKINGHPPSHEDPLDQPDPWVKSDLIARAVRELQGNLVLCGKESLDKSSGQVGALLAHRLDRPFVSAITDLSLDESIGTLQVQRSAGRGIREIIECRLPAVLSVDLGPDLRLPKFAQRQWAETYTPRQLDYGTDVDVPKIVCTRRFQPRPRPKIVSAPDSRLHAYERVMQLLTGSKVEKKGEILTGSPETQVEGIIDFLRANAFLESDSEGQ